VTTEAQEQKEIIKWFRKTYPQYKKCIRLSMSGVNLGVGKKAAMMMNHLKAQGLTVGESDLCFLIPSKGFPGLLIELKKTGWKCSGKAAAEKHQKQLDYLEEMTELGYLATVCIGKDAAIDTIKNYLG